jgi:protein-S-isoprenylcysteine O-methyltransferase Ste14
LLSFLFIILVYFSVVSEERFCLKYYGNSYRECMNKTPRWIGIPKQR